MMYNTNNNNSPEELEAIALRVRNLRQELGPEVTLVAATKMNSAERIQAAVLAGVTACGENRVQEFLEKAPQGAYRGAALHFIGHLQSNKVNRVVGVCPLIQSVDSLPLLLAINRQAEKLGICQEILLEVNIGGESSKSGFSPEETDEAVAFASSLSSVRVMGLMTVAPACGNSADSVPFFTKMRNIFVDIDAKKYDNVSMAFLSMGMSHDYAAAVDCGSNMVRVGSGIFGPRNYTTPEV